MSNRLLNKLVFSSMKNNKKTLFPFLFASSITVMVYYILASLAFGPYLMDNHEEVFYGAQTIAILLEMGSQIVAIFALIFIFYANQFVMKERKREIGLYGVLGLSRWSIGRMLMLESFINGLVSMTAGVIVGSFLNKLMLLMLYKIVGQEPVEGLFFTTNAFGRTILIFGIAFVVCCVYNVFSVNVGNPIELLRSNSTGEKEPKVKCIMLVTGVIALGLGYGLALRCESPSQAITTLFEAIFLVVIGTYFLFITGSIFVLKILKRNPRFYYKTRNFISVSNLIYRMKHNAAGLASICILSTAVILLITCATSLMVLGKENINIMFPNDVMISGEINFVDQEQNYMQLVQEVSKDCSVEIEDLWENMLVCDVFDNTEKGFTFVTKNSGIDMDGQSMMYIMTAEEYEKISGESVKLKSNQVLYADTKNSEFHQIDIQGQLYEVAGVTNIQKCKKISNYEMSLFNNAYMVMADEAARKEMLSYAAESSETYNVVMGFELKDKLEENLRAEYEKRLKDTLGFEEVSFKSEGEKFFISIYGGAFFVGLFLAVLFLMSTVLIIYYKQMSEGFEDKKRYEILKKVGLTDKEVRVTIKRQVMILFFLPVLTAIIHMLVASKIVRLFLRVILLINGVTFNMSIGAVAFVFLIIYALVYKITSNAYYQIVND